MSKQVDLIGNHPTTGYYHNWLECNDIAVTSTKCHRELTEKYPYNKDIIKWFAEIIFRHHYSDYRINKLKENYSKLGYSEYAKYAEQNRKTPATEKTKKGNATEVILTNYVETSLGKTLIKVFKLRYNPNVDQSMKGDDTLMVNLSDDKVVVYMGEAKFRSHAKKDVITDIIKSLSKNKLPLSYSYMIDEIAKSDIKLADKLDEYIIEDIKNNGNLIYVGFLLGDTDTSNTVEKHLCSDNDKFVLISMGITNPESFIDDIFIETEKLLKDPTLI